MKKRLFWLDGIRGILCIWIVLFHYTFRYTELYENDKFIIQFSNGGLVGVMCFFLISGYLCYATIGKYYKTGCKKWLYNKWMRLYPAYLIGCIFIFLFYILADVSSDRINKSVFDFLRSLLMIPYISPLLDGAHWYVFSLVRFYCLFSVFFFFHLQEKKPFWIIILVIVGLNIALKRFIDESNLLEVIVPDFIDPRILEGLLLYKVTKENSTFYASLYFLVGLYLAYSVHPIYAPILLLLFPILLKDDSFSVIKDFLSWNFFVVIGETSYMWYLIHQNVGYILINKLTSTQINYQLIPYLVLIFTFLCSFFIQRGIVDRLNKVI